jgi:hypothetical protein
VVKEPVAFTAVVVASCAIMYAFSACAPATSPAATEAAYTAELLRCVDKSATLAESKACRRNVNAKWGIVETVRDGGAE